MAKVHDKFVIELAEVIKGYGNDPDVDDPFCLSEFYRFYELPNIAVSRENFEKMRPVEPERKRGEWETTSDFEREWVVCSECGHQQWDKTNYCSRCGADMRGDQE